MRNEQATKSPRKLRPQWLLLLVLALAAVAVWVFVLVGARQQPEEAQPSLQESIQTEADHSSQPEPSPSQQAAFSAPEISVQATEEPLFELDHGLTVTGMGPYTGAYVEDGSNDVVSGLLMLSVTNTGDEFIQYAEITLHTENGDAAFSLTTLLPGETVILLELSRLEYDEAWKEATASAANVALFSEEPGLCEELVEISALDGALNVTNVSGKTITGEIVIYYKNYQAGLYYGGITYRVRISDGMEPGEIRQIMSDHFSATDSRIMFVTCG